MKIMIFEFDTRLSHKRVGNNEDLYVYDFFIANKPPVEFWYQYAKCITKIAVF